MSVADADPDGEAAEAEGAGVVVDGTTVGATVGREDAPAVGAGLEDGDGDDPHAARRAASARAVTAAAMERTRTGTTATG